MFFTLLTIPKLYENIVTTGGHEKGVPAKTSPSESTKPLKNGAQEVLNSVCSSLRPCHSLTCVQ